MQKRNRPLNKEKREAIIKAAIQEFYTNGYEGASMNTVYKNAAVSKATVYNHFKNKEELFLELMRMLQERLEENLNYAYSTQSIKEQLYILANKEMAFIENKENLQLIYIATVVMAQKTNLAQRVLSLSNPECMNMAKPWFESAKADGKLHFQSSAFVSQQFIGMLKSFALFPQFYGAKKLSALEKEQVVEEAVHMVLTLYGRPLKV